MNEGRPPRATAHRDYTSAADQAAAVAGRWPVNASRGIMVLERYLVIGGDGGGEPIIPARRCPSALPFEREGAQERCIVLADAITPSGGRFGKHIHVFGERGIHAVPEQGRHGEAVGEIADSIACVGRRRKRGHLGAGDVGARQSRRPPNHGEIKGSKIIGMLGVEGDSDDVARIIAEEPAGIRGRRCRRCSALRPGRALIVVDLQVEDEAAGQGLARVRGPCEDGDAIIADAVGTIKVNVGCTGRNELACASNTSILIWYSPAAAAMLRGQRRSVQIARVDIGESRRSANR